MIRIGENNELEIVKEVDFGLYLDGGEEYGEILLPVRYKPEKYEIGESLNVFIYLDSEDRIIATTETPKATVGQFALLEVNAVTRFGAFLDWGLSKDVLVPFREQKNKMVEGSKYLVYIYLDEDSKRIVASAKIDKFLDNLPPEYEDGEEVDLIIYHKTDIGYRAIINETHTGMLYQDEVFQELNSGDHMKGYVKKVRSDDKVDLILRKQSLDEVEQLAQTILERLKLRNGFIAVNDKSSPEMIYASFGVSKKLFKKAIGNLYKQRLIEFKDDGVSLV